MPLTLLVCTSTDQLRNFKETERAELSQKLFGILYHLIFFLKGLIYVNQGIFVLKSVKNIFYDDFHSSLLPFLTQAVIDSLTSVD